MRPISLVLFAAVVAVPWAAAAKGHQRDPASDRGDRTSSGGGTTIEHRSGLEFVWIPGGTFHFGCEPLDAQCGDDEKPGRKLMVPGFWMGKTDVTVAAYARCVRAGACRRPHGGVHCNWGVSGKDRHPINCIDWEQARTFCSWIGGRLPTAEQWEYAAKGRGGRLYPWGSDPVTADRANSCGAGCQRLHAGASPAGASEDDGWTETSPVGAYPRGATPQGLLDMIGNVWQWTASEYDATTKEIRGGSWSFSNPRFLRASSRGAYAPRSWYGDLGVRCER